MGHFTFVTNMFCKDDSVMVFETFDPFRSKEQILTDEGKTLIQKLMFKENERIRVKGLNVALQTENGRNEI